MKKDFCIHGHEIAIVGRDKHGNCNGCTRPVMFGLRKSYRIKQFCLKGHDTFICGRTENNNCNDCRVPYKKQWYINNKDILKPIASEYYIKNKKKIRKWQKEYNLEHHDEITAKNLEIEKIKLKNDPLFRLKYYLRRRLYHALKGNAKRGSAVKDLGCTISFFKQYIEAKFYNNMSWNNWGKVWQLDHIEPFFKFDLTDRKQLLEVCHYTNMQPLTIKDHREKSNKELGEITKYRRKNNGKQKAK